MKCERRRRVKHAYTKESGRQNNIISFYDFLFSDLANLVRQSMYGFIQPERCAVFEGVCIVRIENTKHIFKTKQIETKRNESKPAPIAC